MSYPVGRLCFFYLLYDKEDPVYLYVGSTWNMIERMNSHRKRPIAYFKQVGKHRMRFECLEPAREVHSDEERFFIEQWYIDLLLPDLNIRNAVFPGHQRYRDTHKHETSIKNKKHYDLHRQEQREIQNERQRDRRKKKIGLILS